MRTVRIAFLLAAALVLPACAGTSEAATFTELIAPERASEVLSDGDGDLVLLDVRTPEEFAQARIGGSINLDVSSRDFADRLATLDPEATYVVYCRTGNRSAEAVRMMQDLGFSRIYEIDGGIARWYEAGLPIE
jgi:rhodanese-related sulfurtransferase